MKESRRFTLILLFVLILVVLLAVASGKAEAQAHTLGSALSACWGQVQSASVFSWKTFETDALTSSQVAQILAWDDSVKFAGSSAHPQFPADTASTFARYTLDFTTINVQRSGNVSISVVGQHYADVRVSSDGHAYVFPFLTTAPQGSAWHGCDDLVIPAQQFTSLLPQHLERHTTAQPGDVFQCALVYSSYPEYINVCYYAPKGS